MQRRLRIRIATLLLGCVLTPAAAQGTTYQVTGTVTSLDYGGFLTPFITSVSVGDTYSATLAVNEAAVDIDSDPTFGNYPLGVSYSLSVGSYSTSGVGAGAVFNTASDRFFASVPSGLPALDGGLFVGADLLGLIDNDGSVWSSDSIPTAATLTNLAPFESVFASITFTDGTGGQTIQIGGISIQVVPEAGAALLLGSALLGLRVRRQG